MQIQSLLIGLFFLSAVVYVVRLLWRSFEAPANGAGCAKGCGTCDVARNIDRRLTPVPVRVKR